MNKPLSGRRILVVEDDIHLRMTMEDVLVDLGCEFCYHYRHYGEGGCPR